MTHKNETADLFNLQGIAIGNAYIDPISQMDIASLAHQIGIVDQKERDQLEFYQNLAIDLIKQSRHFFQKTLINLFD